VTRRKGLSQRPHRAPGRQQDGDARQQQRILAGHAEKPGASVARNGRSGAIV